MAGPNPRQLTRTLDDLPSDILLDTLLEIQFKDKINAGKVCKRWNELLRTSPPAPLHWEVDYNVSAILLRRAYMVTDSGHVPEDLVTDIVRYIPVAAAFFIGK
jgi:hypothetical protein